MPQLEYELISGHPYELTLEEVLSAVHLRRTGIDKQEASARHDEVWSTFFARSMACMRASPLPKSYGWGLHFDGGGKVALVGVETSEYQRMLADPALRHTAALRSK